MLASVRLSSLGALSTFLLLSGSAQAASTVSIGTPTLIAASTVNMTNDLGAGMTTNVDWIHFLSGNNGFHGLLNATAVVAPDLQKSVAVPFINRAITFTEHASAGVNDWPETKGGVTNGTSYSYSDAASVPNPDSIATEGFTQAGDFTLAINVPDTNAYVLRIYGRDRWTPFQIKSAILSDGTTASAQAGGAATDLYRFDIAYQSATPNQTLTVTFGFDGNSQPASVGAATLSTVPEPVSMSAMSIGALGLLRRRRATLIPNA